MGKRITTRRRGSGSPAYKCPSHRFKGVVKFRKYDKDEKEGSLRGDVMGFVDDPGHQSILMRIKYENDEEQLLVAPEGIAIGDAFKAGAKAKPSLGGVFPLSKMPDGAYIYNIELQPGDCGKLVRAPGSYATLIARDKGAVMVKLPSRRIVPLNPLCRAQLGVVSGGGRLEKPMVKAGTSHYKKRATNKLWPKVRGVKMNSYTHPHGGKQHHIGKSSCVARGTPPGRKVGHIAPKKTGRKKGRK